MVPASEAKLHPRVGAMVVAIVTHWRVIEMVAKAVLEVEMALGGRSASRWKKVG